MKIIAIVGEKFSEETLCKDFENYQDLIIRISDVIFQTLMVRKGKKCLQIISEGQKEVKERMARGEKADDIVKDMQNRNFTSFIKEIKEKGLTINIK